MDRERDIEEVHLMQASHHIAKAEERVAHQEQIIKELTMDGHNTTDAKHFLQSLEATLETMRTHRQLLLRRVAAQGTAEPAR